VPAKGTFSRWKPRTSSPGERRVHARGKRPSTKKLPSPKLRVNEMNSPLQGRMKVSAPVKAPQRIAHKRKARAAEKSKPAPLKSTRMRHPRVRLLPTKGRAQMIYSLSGFEEEQTSEKISLPPALF